MDFPPPPPSPGAENAPPPYANANQVDGEAEEEIVQPVILVLSKRFIHAQSKSSFRLSGTGDRGGGGAPIPLYELSHDITQSSDGETKVELSRLVPSVRMSTMNGSGTPRVAHRSSHIYDLKRLPPLLADGFPYCLDAVSRSQRRWSSSKSAAAAVCGGKLGLKTSSFPLRAEVVKIVRLGSEKEREKEKEGSGIFPKGYKAMRKTSGGSSSGNSVFESRKAHDHYEWIGPDGNRIAVEDSAAAAATDDDDGNGERIRLIVTTPLPRVTMDALVASWCLKTWRDRIELSIGKSRGPTNGRLYKGKLKYLMHAKGVAFK
ncbi:hypothetical protein SLS62_002980 [Diatrype stigma]|uniref:Uncharacterized protein n=1 Tax=Diatrype stigma TaxID=117547 RepID=A0AAN9YV91_9PEZI